MTAQTFAPGDRVRHTLKGITGTVDPDAVDACWGMVPVQWDGDDAWLTNPAYLETIPAHRPAVAPVADVHAVVAENGGTTIVAPPTQARRSFSQAGLASVIQPDVAAGLHRAHTAEAAARALAAYVRAVELGQDIGSHYEAAVTAAHAWAEADQ